MIEINGLSGLEDPYLVLLEREMYELLGSNMTRIIPDTDPNWRSPAEFERWKNEVLRIGLSQGTQHLLLVDGQGLRGFVSFTVPEGGAEV
jgi:hypothetical protein